MAAPHRRYTYGAGWAIRRIILRGAKVMNKFRNQKGKPIFVGRCSLLVFRKTKNDGRETKPTTRQLDNDLAKGETDNFIPLSSSYLF